MTTRNLSEDARLPAHVETAAAAGEPHGRAALLLVESLIHGLLARSVIDVADAVEIVEAAVDVAEEDSHEEGDAHAAAQISSALGAISSSLSRDLPDQAKGAGAAENSS